MLLLCAYCDCCYGVVTVLVPVSIIMFYRCCYHGSCCHLLLAIVVIVLIVALVVGIARDKVTVFTVSS